MTHLRRLLRHPITHYRAWRYHNLAFLGISLVALIILIDTPLVQETIGYIGSLGYLGAFIVGVLLVSIFTAGPALVVLYALANTLHPLEIALIAGLGSLVGDLLIFRFIRDGISEELQPLFTRMGNQPYIQKVLSTPYFFWVTPLLGAIIIASPFPDEIGITLLGISRIKTWQFILISFALNTLGISIIVLLANV